MEINHNCITFKNIDPFEILSHINTLLSLSTTKHFPLKTIATFGIYIFVL